MYFTDVLLVTEIRDKDPSAAGLDVDSGTGRPVASDPEHALPDIQRAQDEDDDATDER